MTLVTRATIESLAAFRGQGNLATSLYLDTDKSRRSRKEIAVSFKKLLSDGRSRLDRLDLARETRESLEADLGALARFGAGPLETFKAPGLAVFGCSRSKLWEILELPHGPRDRIHFEGNFYVRPLASIVDRYRRICALTLDRREARWHEIHMGAIAPLDRLESPVPSKVRGVPETETKRAERRVEAHVLEHLKTVARSTFELFKAHRFDWLFLGCEETLGPDLEPLFHAYLRDRLKGRLKARVGDSPSTVRLELERLAFFSVCKMFIAPTLV